MIEQSQLQDRCVLPLIRTLFNICIFRSGPEDIPYSWLLLYVTVFLRTLILFLGVNVIDSFTLADVRTDLIIWLVGLLCFGFVVVVAGKSPRLVQTMTALIGISALITLFMIIVNVVGRRYLTAELMTTVANLALLWSIVIKGHIIARAIDWHWYAGLLISIAILFVQVAVPADLLGLS